MVCTLFVWLPKLNFLFLFTQESPVTSQRHSCLLLQFLFFLFLPLGKEKQQLFVGGRNNLQHFRLSPGMFLSVTFNENVFLRFHTKTQLKMIQSGTNITEIFSAFNFLSVQGWYGIYFVPSSKVCESLDCVATWTCDWWKLLKKLQGAKQFLEEI